jgi:hypothetical protein
MVTTAKKPVGRIWSHHLDVVGLRFRFTKSARRALADMLASRGSIPGVKLVREPDNPKDGNAIKVMLPQRILGGKQLGYIRAPAAAMLAPKMDAGRLKVHGATLLELRADDDWNSGELHIRFMDVPLPRKRSRSTTKTKAAK